ncbi:uncharacterized protein LOC135133568 [Zophobas morio]|uniref:uncharacterized protein LOC135133568 n=1 Tax=Zophobas morio TaxID=2755281 RepID=UPI003083438B
MAGRFLCFPLRTGAFFMVFATTMLGVGCFWAGSEQANLLNNEMVVKKAYFPLTIGLTLIISAFFLLHGTLKVKPHWIFSYLVLSSTCIFILTVIVLVIAPTALCVFAVLWYGQFCVNSFYKLVVDAKEFFGEVVAVFDGDITIVHIV